jgi:hypothetical protein
MSMHKVLLFVLLSLSSLYSSNALAQSVGTYDCSECLLTAPSPDGDTLVFIRTVVNQDVSTWWNSTTNKGKSVTICNGSKCVVYQYLANGNFVLTAEAPILGGGSGGGGSGGGGSIGYGIIGYEPVYQTVQVCVQGVCSNQQVLVGYRPIYGTEYIVYN